MDTRDRIVLGMVLAAAVAIAMFSALNYVLLRGGVLEVREVAPIEAVRVSEITTVVQVAVPKHAVLYRYCYEDGTGYDISIMAVTGGVEQTVAKGKYTRNATESISQYAASYFYGTSGELDFGESSSECSHLQGWR